MDREFRTVWWLLTRFCRSAFCQACDRPDGLWTFPHRCGYRRGGLGMACDRARPGRTMGDLVAAATLLGVGSALVLSLYAVSFVLAIDRRPVIVEPFLSGHAPTEHAVSRYHARWYVVTIVFLAFDMEMAFMYPWSLVVADVGAKAVLEMFGFLGVLFVGVVYAWREGGFRWA